VTDGRVGDQPLFEKEELTAQDLDIPVDRTRRSYGDVVTTITIMIMYGSKHPDSHAFRSMG
jgi:hypothetical protein